MSTNASKGDDKKDIEEDIERDEMEAMIGRDV